MKNINFIRKIIFISVFCLQILLYGCGTADDVVMIMSEEEIVSEETEYNMTQVLENVQNKEICIYICGAVEKPGVYQLKSGSRLYEAIEKAGGLTKEADGKSINLARQLSDSEQVVIFTNEETEELGKTYMAENGVSTQQKSSLVNINTATLSELTTVTGIGESRAQAIISYRNQNGRFGCIEDIKKVDGIKDGLFSKIKDFITVS